jgi:hypothetical protein
MISFKSFLQLDLFLRFAYAACNAKHLRSEANTIQQAPVARQRTTTTALRRQNQICNFHDVKLVFFNHFT